MFCKYCGIEIEDDCSFCSNCGKQFISVNEKGTASESLKVNSVHSFFKKVKSVISVFFCVLLLLSLTGALDPVFEKIGNLPIFKGNDTKGVFQDNTSYFIKDETKVEDVNDVQGYAYVGDTITLDNGISYTVMQAGTYTDLLGKVYVFVEIDLVNGSEGDLYVTATDAKFYADNYLLDTGYPSDMKDTENLVSDVVSTGRRLSGRFYAECSNYNSISRIDVEIGSVIIVIKEDNGLINESQSVSSDQAMNMYGTYTYDNGETDVMTANVGVATGDGNDYISITALSYGGHYTAEFTGTLVQIGDNTYTVTDEFLNRLKIIFDDSGAQVVGEHLEFSTFEVFEGYYTKVSELDFNNVG